MTNHSDRTQSYTGIYGVVDVPFSKPLEPLERGRLLQNIWSIVAEAKDPIAFFNNIVLEVRALRCMQTLAHERTNKARLREAKTLIKNLEFGAPIEKLSQICLRDIEVLRRQTPEASDSELFIALKFNLPKFKSGRSPDDALVFAAVNLAKVFRVYMPSPPTSEKERPFVVLLQAVAQAADGKPRSALHRVAEEALRIQLETYGPGLAFFSR